MESAVLSVGIDIGTSTTQLVLSRLTFQNRASSFSVPHIVISKKEVIYQSKIIFTPLLDGYEIDYPSIEQFVSREYLKAGIDKQKIQMGAIIITGETARKENAEKVVQTLSHYAGDFVVATAGPDLEGILAAKGAGVSRYSRESKSPMINLDIGGGTTNLAALDGDRVLDTACFDVGGRLIRIDPQTLEVRYIAPKIKRLIARLNLEVHEGSILQSAKQLEPIMNTLVRIIENSVGIGERNPFFDLFVTNHCFNELDPSKIRAITFSGGVADCMEKGGEEAFIYGDIGLLLGRKLRQSRLFQDKTVHHSKETIRATVVGAGSYSVTVSGSTISYSQHVLPLRNLPILHLSVENGEVNANRLADKIKNQLDLFRVDGRLVNTAISLTGLKSPTFDQLQSCARGIRDGANELIDKALPLIVITYEDIAKALGHSLFSYLPRKYPFVCIDRVKAETSDYIDIGEPVAHAAVLPVSVKTLIFN
ncbi:MAG: ethanolamine ammonia-lyase reactivating factor EutA [Sporolactobacillus sp.]